MANHFTEAYELFQKAVEPDFIDLDDTPSSEDTLRSWVLDNRKLVQGWLDENPE